MLHGVRGMGGIPTEGIESVIIACSTAHHMLDNMAHVDAE